MGRLTVVFLFSKNRNIEPSAIIQCDTSGEYYSYTFFDWRDAVHYINYRNTIYIDDDDYLN